MNQDVKQFTVHSRLLHCLCVHRSTSSAYSSDKKRTERCLWYILAFMPKCKLTLMQLPAWGWHTIPQQLWFDWQSICLPQPWGIRNMGAMLVNYFNVAMLHLCWREVDCWISSMKSGDVQESLEPLPVYWLVDRKSHGFLHPAVTLCSDWFREVE